MNLILNVNLNFAKTFFFFALSIPIELCSRGLGKTFDHILSYTTNFYIKSNPSIIYDHLFNL